MQKKIIALAVAGLMSGAALAQSNVTVYGLVDAGYGRFSGTSAGVNNTASTLDAINSGLASSSRLGFRGEEALGNGLKAIFTIEHGITADGGQAQVGTAASAIGASRQTFVGLSSADWGTVTLGHQYTPFHNTLAAVDPFGTTGVASATVIHPDVGTVARAGSAVQYAHKFGPVAVSALYGMNEQNKTAAGATAGGVFSWNAVYAQGPIVAGIAQIQAHNTSGTIGVNAESTLIGGVYNFGVASLHAGVNNYTADGAAGAKSVINHRDWHLGVTVPMGAHSFRVAYNRANDKLIANEDATHWGLGYQYDMSKRTNLYAMYGSVSNKNGAAYTVNAGTIDVLSHASYNAAAAPAGSAREKGLVMGMRHSF